MSAEQVGQVAILFNLLASTLQMSNGNYGLAVIHGALALFVAVDMDRRERKR